MCSFLEGNKKGGYQMLEKAKRYAMISAGSVTGVVAGAGAAFASGEAVVTPEQISAITSDIMANLEVIIPAGLAVLGVMIGISLIPRVIYKFF
jgi:hypothetical protein